MDGKQSGGSPPKRPGTGGGEGRKPSPPKQADGWSQESRTDAAIDDESDSAHAPEASVPRKYDVICGRSRNSSFHCKANPISY